MKILTLNTWQERGPWRERWDVILERLFKLRPQIAAFQELFNPCWAQEVQKLTGFSTLLFPREGCGLVIYTEYAVTSWGVERLVQSPLEEYSRYVLWAEICLPQGKFFLMNAHLSWKMEDGMTRRKQAGEIVEFMERKNAKADWVLVGDLNSPPDSEEIRWLIKNGHFRDLFKETHPEEGIYTWDNRNPYAASSGHKMPDRRIDYLLVRGSGPIFENLKSCDLVFTKPTLQGIWASDHYGVMAEFQ